MIWAAVQNSIRSCQQKK